jgi:hypothetical protein
VTAYYRLELVLSTMKRWRTIGLLLGWSTLSVLLTACNPEKLPGLGRVTGTVTVDGQPVASATVTFDGAQPGEPPSLGQTDASGKYELYYSRGHKGATIGEHVVRISTYGGTASDEGEAQKETIPARYNAKSELKADVKRGSNNHNFELKSGGEIIQPGEEAPKKGKAKKGPR